MNSFTYNINHKATATIRKKISSSVKHNQPFLLKTNITGDMLDYYVDIGGWVITKQEDGKYNGVLSHVNNFLPFLDGPNKIEFDKPIKRKYTRRTVIRVKTL